MSRGQLRGRASGVMVGAVFGLVWAGSALATLSSVVAVPLMVASVAIFAVLTIGSRRLRPAATARPASVAPAVGVEMDKVRQRFTSVVVIEVVAILAAARILAASGHARWIPAVICGVVGLHFIPLARLFRVRLYYATALALCLATIATMVLGALGGAVAALAARARVRRCPGVVGHRFDVASHHG